MRKKLGFAGAAALAGVLLLMGGALHAADESTGPPEIDSAEMHAKNAKIVERFMPRNVFGIQIIMDPETGVLKAPTAEQAAELSAALKARYGDLEARAKTRPSVVVEKNGMMSAELDSSHLKFSTLRVLSDGTLVYECSQDHDHGDHRSNAVVSGAAAE